MAKAKPDAKHTSIGCGALIAIFAAIYLISLCSEPAPPSPESRRLKHCGDSGKIEAYTIAQIQIEKELKAPGSASFPLEKSASVRFDNTNDCLFVIQSYVDAENTFGAKLRNQWEASVLYNPHLDTWKVLSARFN
jgi:hypothetical protein